MPIHIKFAGISLLIIASVFGVSAQLAGQRPKADKTGATGIVKGHVTMDGEAVAKVKVILVPEAELSATVPSLPVIQDTTDENGKFTLSDVPVGKYTLTTISLAGVLSNEVDAMMPGKKMDVRAGEELSLDLPLIRGGVITGRVTDADDQPVIGKRIRLQLVDERGQKRFLNLPVAMGETDDRGIYRIYNLAAGRYLVSINHGSTKQTGSNFFYPGVTSEAQAKIVEVKAGSETTNIDLKLGLPKDFYVVSGRAIDAETNQPIANLRVGFRDAVDHRIMNRGLPARTNTNGEFRFEGMQSGRYIAFAIFDRNNEFYCEPTPFEVAGSDVQGVELQLRRGTTISGVVMVEGARDQVIAEQLAKLKIYCSSVGAQSSLSTGANVAADGSFRLSGVQPGKIRIMVSSYPTENFFLKRVERNGLGNARNEIEISSGEQVTDVRVIVVYGKGTIRGQLKVQNGTLPDGTRVIVRAVRPDDSAGLGAGFAQADASGQFVLQNIPAGEYDLTVMARTPADSPFVLQPVNQSVTVKNGVETKTEVIMDIEQIKRSRPVRN